MTPEQLLGMSADQLEAIPQADMERFFAPFLDVTRPERVAKLSPSPKAKQQSGSKPTVAQRNPEGYDKAKQFMMENLGIDLDDI